MAKPPPAKPSAPSQPAVGDADKGQANAAVVEHARAAVVPSFDFRIDYCLATVIGTKRETNEDAMCCVPARALFGMADGMGGHAAGEVAAEMSLEVASTYLASKESRRIVTRYARDPDVANRRKVFALLDAAMRAANKAVMEAGAASEAHKGMGTTLDLLLLVRDRAFIAHVGDSRVYLVRSTATLQLTHDHALYDSLRTSGKRTPARRFSRSPLANSIGQSSRIAVDTLFVDLNPGERIIMCTDGIFNALEGEAAFGQACRANDVLAVSRRLIQAAREYEGTDDASVVAVNVGERFVQRTAESGPRARDIEVVSDSPLLTGLAPAHVLATLVAAVEVELDSGKKVPRAVANDRVAYLLLDGLVQLSNGRTLGAPALLMAESLLDVALRDELPVVSERARLLRIRHDDFNEVCAHDPALAAELYKRIARHLATTAAGR